MYIKAENLNYIIATKYYQRRIIHPKINGRAAIKVNIYYIIVLTIVKLKKRKEKILKK